jgi:hypothetical protein
VLRDRGENGRGVVHEAESLSGAEDEDERLLEKCNKDGCTKESMEAFMKSASGILSQEQMATLKAECSKMHDKKDAKA